MSRLTPSVRSSCSNNKMHFLKIAMGLVSIISIACVGLVVICTACSQRKSQPWSSTNQTGVWQDDVAASLTMCCEEGLFEIWGSCNLLSSRRVLFQSDVIQGLFKAVLTTPFSSSSFFLAWATLFPLLPLLGTVNMENNTAAAVVCPCKQQEFRYNVLKKMQF